MSLALVPLSEQSGPDVRVEIDLHVEVIDEALDEVDRDEAGSRFHTGVHVQVESWKTKDGW